MCIRDSRNTDGKEENLLGVSVQKMFIPSIANTIGTDFTKYKVVKRGQFTLSLIHIYCIQPLMAMSKCAAPEIEPVDIDVTDTVAFTWEIQ